MHSLECSETLTANILVYYVNAAFRLQNNYHKIINYNRKIDISIVYIG